jgi:hypothetical protein
MNNKRLKQPPFSLAKLISGAFSGGYFFDKIKAFAKEDGEVIIDEQGRRLK